MNNTINGKTPDEIKKGLECVSSLVPIYEDCGECPYAVDLESFAICGQMVSADALAYIQQLENQIGELTEKVAQLEASQPKWVSVEERLPERGVYFVRCIHNYTDNDEYECHKVAIYLSEEYRWIDVGNLLKVTHWMPIPEPPKECKHVREL